MAEQNKVADALKGILGDIYSLYLKTHGYHWNVEGPRFRSLHLQFEENYRALWESMDEIAERIRALGVYAPMGGAALAEHSRIDSTDNHVPDADAMIQNLIAGHETFTENAKAALEVMENDPVTEDMVIALIQAHDKMAWMLRSSLEG